jgi:hypothetical protein
MVQRIHHIVETRDDWAIRTTLLEALYSGYFTLIMGTYFYYVLGPMGFLSFQKIENVVGVSTVIFFIIFFRGIIKANWYHNSVNSGFIPILSVIFVSFVIFTFISLVTHFDWIFLIMSIIINGSVFYELRKCYLRSYLGTFISKKLKQLRK